MSTNDAPKVRLPIWRPQAEADEVIRRLERENAELRAQLAEARSELVRRESS